MGKYVRRLKNEQEGMINDLLVDMVIAEDQGSKEKRFTRTMENVTMTAYWKEEDLMLHL